MSPHTSVWWTDARIDATVDRAFIISKLTLEERRLLEQSISFGGGLTDDTYLDWILERAKKLFLILVEIGVPDQIFGLVDESYDDADLPISLSAVPELRLTQDPDGTLDKKFYKTQFKFLIRNITEGKNVQYTEEETIPVEAVGLKAGIVPLGRDGTDKVRLASSYREVFARKRVPLNQPPNHVSEDDVLSEIRSLRKFAHEHLASVYASYSHGDSIYVLLTPASEYTLKSFLADTPKHFDNLPKLERREILINWPHCLANGLDWLHSKGVAHGAVRPSNVLIDANFRIFLGQCKAFNITHSSFKADDVEIYQYAAPERWKRAATVQTSTTGKVALPSGGRTARKQSDSKGSANAADSSKNRPAWTPRRPSTSRSSLDTVKPASTALPLRPASKSSPTRRADRSSAQYESSVVSSSSSGGTSQPLSGGGGQSLTTRFRAHTHGSQVPSIATSIATADTSGDSSAARSALRSPVILAPPEVRTTIVQTWHSTTSDPLPTDIFALGAVISEILTLLCKRSSSAFSRFRSAKNRTPGRGGGLADASFHANINQVLAWLSLLAHDAKKKATKEEGRVFRAVEPMIDILVACLAREPEERIKSRDLEKRLSDCVWYSAGFGKVHCYKALQALPPPKFPMSCASSPPPSHDFPSSPKSPDVGGPPPSEDYHLEYASNCADSVEEGPENTLSLGPDSSYSSLASFNFDYQFNPGRSEASLGEDLVDIAPECNVKHRHKNPAVGHRIVDEKRTPYKKTRGHSWDNWHNNDSSIDPSLVSSRSNHDIVYANAAYEPSSFDDAHQRSFLIPDSRPTSMILPLSPAPAPVQMHGENSNPQTTITQPSHLYDTQLTVSHHDNSIQRKASTNNEVKRPSSSTSHQPNTSRTRKNRNKEPPKVDELGRLSGPGEVPAEVDTKPAHVKHKREGISNFSRPRIPRQQQTQQLDKPCLEYV
jgi:serine/threonine protein kinase